MRGRKMPAGCANIRRANRARVRLENVLHAGARMKTPDDSHLTGFRSWHATWSRAMKRIACRPFCLVLLSMWILLYAPRIGYGQEAKSQPEPAQSASSSEAAQAQ